MREDRVGEKVSIEFDVLGMGKGSAKIEVQEDSSQSPPEEEG